MILQSLAQLYERRSRDPDPARRLPSPGLEDKDIPFVVELRNDGTVVQIRDTRVLEGKKLRGQSFLVPQAVKKTSGVAANLLWDTAEYALGASAKAKPERLLEQQLAFKQRVQALAEQTSGDVGLLAVLSFLAEPRLDMQHGTPLWDELVATNPVVSFELQGDGGALVCQRPAVMRAVLSASGAGAAVEANQAMCLIEGQVLPIERLHTAIKGVWGAQSSGANIVSFNLDAFNSYGKAQGGNAPVSARAAFAYTTALNAMLDRDSRNRVQVGDSSTVFWADAQSQFDGEFTLADLFGEPKPDNPDRGRDAVKALYQALRSGQLPESEAKVHFYVLGLAPNAARISVRFWLPGITFAELAPRIRQHFDDLHLVRSFDSDPEHPSLFRLLSSLALQGKLDNVPPRLAGEWMRAILEGTALPAVLLNAAVMRCKAEQDVSYLRACVLKAWLNRNARSQRADDRQHFKEELDMNQEEPAYRLGRLFATLERIQEQSAGGPGKLNSTIRDRYYGAASTTPVAVFTTLLRLKNAHLKKLTMAQMTYFEKLISEILAPLQGFPRQLPLVLQGQFALGYYHQRQAFYAKRPDETQDNSNAKEA
jgi:CRISPR-associated protein Csd1